eukprot:5156672-Amphidinium_carterae.1
MTRNSSSAVNLRIDVHVCVVTTTLHIPSKVVFYPPRTASKFHVGEVIADPEMFLTIGKLVSDHLTACAKNRNVTARHLSTVDFYQFHLDCYQWKYISVICIAGIVSSNVRQVSIKPSFLGELRLQISVDSSWITQNMLDH